MRLIGIIVVASAALLSGVVASVAAPGAESGAGAGAQSVTPHAFASGIDLQTGRSATIDWADGINDKYRFSTGFLAAGSTSPCDTARIQALFCRDQD